MIELPFTPDLTETGVAEVVPARLLGRPRPVGILDGYT
jgi:hypothetical protein